MQTADTTPLTYYGMKKVPLVETAIGKKMFVEFAVCDAHGPILAVGNFTDKHEDRNAWFSGRDAHLNFEGGHKMILVKENKHWLLNCHVPLNVGDKAEVNETVGEKAEASDNVGEKAEMGMNVGEKAEMDMNVGE